MAISWARRILVMVSGHHAPAFTVASLATTTAGRPSMRPIPVTTPAAGRLALVAVIGDQQANFEKEAPGSSSAARCARGPSSSRRDAGVRCAPAPPPWRRRSSSFFNCSTSRRIWAARAGLEGASACESTVWGLLSHARAAPGLPRLRALQNAIERISARALHHDGNRYGDGQDVVFEAFAFLRAGPVHEEPVGDVHGQNRDYHVH